MSDVSATLEPTSADDASPTAEAIAVLVANHREFLRFVERRVGDRALAEELLQSAFVKSLAKVEQVRTSVIGWFYQVLRNAVVDHHRQRAADAQRLDAFATELELAAPAGELRDEVCRCVARLAETLKPEYATALRRIELDGLAVKDFAAEAGISESNAGVRVFRAREALRRELARSCGTCAEHGCFQCTCQRSAPAAATV